MNEINKQRTAGLASMYINADEVIEKGGVGSGRKKGDFVVSHNPITGKTHHGRLHSSDKDGTYHYVRTTLGNLEYLEGKHIRSATSEESDKIHKKMSEGTYADGKTFDNDFKEDKKGASSFGSFKDHSHEQLSKLDSLARTAKEKNSKSEKLSEEEQHAMDNHADIQSELNKRIQKSEEDELEKGGVGSGRHKEGDTVIYEGKKYKAGKYDPSVNLRYLHDHETGKHSEDHKGDVLQVNESRLQKQEETDLEKGGEGSKGGRVIGHTKSGKPIYSTADHESHKGFSSDDHEDAYKVHEKKIEEGGSRTNHAYEGLLHFNKMSDIRNGHSDLEKGGKRAMIGEIRAYNGQKWVKHVDGWVHVSDKKAILEKPGGKRETASDHHVEHFNHHLNNNTPGEEPAAVDDKKIIPNTERKEPELPTITEKNVNRGILEELTERRDEVGKKVAEMRRKGYDKRGASAILKSAYNKACNEWDKADANIKKFEFNQDGAKKVLQSLGLGVAPKHSTSIRGYATYGKGYEIDNKYDPSYISFHGVTTAEAEGIGKKLLEAGIPNSIGRGGVQLHKRK